MTTNNKTHIIAICGNIETLTDGYFLGVDGSLQNEATEIVQAGVQVVRDSNRNVDYKIESFFPDWHGGKFYCAGNTIGGKQYGYRSGHAATLEENPPLWLCDLIDQIADVMSDKACELGRKQSARLAQEVIDSIAREESPSRFVIDNLSRNELPPDLLARFEAAVETWRK